MFFEGAEHFAQDARRALCRRNKASCCMSVMKKTLKPVASELMHTKQTCHTHCYLLSSRLYCRFWNRTKSAAHRGSRTLPPVRNCTSPRRIFFLFGTIIYLLFSDFKLFPEKILFQKTVPHRALFVDMYFADLTAVSDEISVPAFRKRFNTQRSIEPAPKATARNICDLFGVVLCFKNKK